MKLIIPVFLILMVFGYQNCDPKLINEKDSYCNCEKTEEIGVAQGSDFHLLEGSGVIGIDSRIPLDMPSYTNEKIHIDYCRDGSVEIIDVPASTVDRVNSFFDAEPMVCNTWWERSPNQPVCMALMLPHSEILVEGEWLELTGKGLSCNPGGTHFCDENDQVEYREIGEELLNEVEANLPDSCP